MVWAYKDVSGTLEAFSATFWKAMKAQQRLHQTYLQKIKNTKTAGAKQLNRRRESKEPVYEEVLQIPVRNAQ